jgi:hypothetical protein
MEFLPLVVFSFVVLFGLLKFSLVVPKNLCQIDITDDGVALPVALDQGSPDIEFYLVHKG